MEALRSLSPAQRQLAEENLPWVYELVTRHMGLYPTDDRRPRRAGGRRATLEQAGALALVETIQRYNPSRSAVTTFVTRPVLTAIILADRHELGPLIRTPRQGEGGHRGYATPKEGHGEDALPLETYDPAEASNRRLDGEALVGRARAELERHTVELLTDPEVRRRHKNAVGAASVPRAVDTFLTGLLHGASTQQDAERLGITKERVRQIRGPVAEAFHHWAAALRSEPFNGGSA